MTSTYGPPQFAQSARLAIIRQRSATRGKLFRGDAQAQADAKLLDELAGYLTQVREADEAEVRSAKRSLASMGKLLDVMRDETAELRKGLAVAIAERDDARQRAADLEGALAIARQPPPDPLADVMPANTTVLAARKPSRDGTEAAGNGTGGAESPAKPRSPRPRASGKGAATQASRNAPGDAA
jgi:hypothetical protein